jgi:hypothetical protein
MVAFLSCAHQNRNYEEADIPSEDTYAESDMGSKGNPQEPSGLGETSEASLDSTSPSESGAPKESLAQADTTQNSQAVDSLEKELDSGDSKLSNEPVKEALNNNEMKVESAKEPSFEDELEGKTQTPDSLGAEAASAGAAVGANAANPDLVEPKKEELIAKEAIAPKIEPPSTETLNLDKKVTKPRFARAGFKVPKIPAKAITRKGTKLNRFYFVRQGDTSKHVSELIYGTPNQASKLVKWNGKSWVPGKVIYYSSAEKPKDPKMDSFYKEKGIAFEEYTVSSGDWLSKIALKKLGSPKSWVEIAVINGIKSPKTLEVGQKIAIYPKDLTAKPVETMIAKNEPVEQPVKQPAPVEPPPPAVQPPAPQPAEAEAPVAAPTPKPEVKSAPVGFDSQKFIEQNMFAILIFLAAFFLLLLMVVKRRNKARAAVSSEDFGDGEEGFQPPTKLKRK